MPPENTETTVIDDTQGVTEAVVKEASTYGWVSKDKFRGDQKDWVDADEFVRRGRNSIPILRGKLTTVESQLATLRADHAQLMADSKELKAIGYNQAKREYEGKITELKKIKAKALEDGNAEAVVEADELLAETRANPPVEPKATKPAAGGNGNADGIPPETQAWLDANQWYTTNPVLQARANALGVSYVQSGLVGVAMLNKVREDMEMLFPEEMGVTEPKGMTHGKRGRRTGAPPNNPTDKSYDNLPAEAKAACDRMVARKQLTREEYVANYDFE